jgi:predicted nucleotidyltransferase
MEQQEVISKIKNVAMKTLPPRSSLFLYGSRARGDAHANSDWDLLILLDKQSLRI